MGKNRRYLRLVDDPVARILWMLRNMPLESTLFYLDLITGQAARLSLLSVEDRNRIAALLLRIPISRLDKAA